MFSQSQPDTRPEWQDWAQFRIEKKREVLDRYAPMIKNLDPNHILIGYPGGGFVHEFDNGYVTECGASSDYFYMIKDQYLDVIRGAPGVSRNFLEVVDAETSFMHYVVPVLIGNGYRSSKPFILQCERELNLTAPSVEGKISIWAEFMKSVGVDMLWWQLDEADSCSGTWTEPEKDEIGETRNISNLPKIEKVTKSEFAFIDLPFESGKYYTEENFTLMFAMKQVKAFMDASLPFDCLSEDEIMLNPAILNDYKAVGFVLPEMYYLLAPNEFQQIINNFQANGGNIWNGNPLDGYLYYTSGYTNTNYLDSLRSFYDANNIVRNYYDGHFIYIVGNKPYIFMLSRESDFSGIIEVNIKDWEMSDCDTTFVEYNSGEGYSVTICNNKAIFDLTLTQQEPYLFILNYPTCINEEVFPTQISFLQNYPNPFNQTTRIPFSIPRESNIELNIFNIKGQRIKQLVSEQLSEGNHSVIWNGDDELGKTVSSGIYYYKLNVNGKTEVVRRCLMLK